MIDERDLFERTAQRFDPPSDSLQRLFVRRERRRRNRRVGNAAIALVLAVLAALGLARAFRNIGHEVPAAPPTGTIVFSRQLSQSDRDYLFTIGTDGSGERPLMERGTDMFSISPDGSRVLYPDLNSSRPDWVLPAVVNLDGSDRHLIRSSVPMDGLWPIAWSSDGARILGQARDPRGIYTARSSDGGDLAQVTSTPGRKEDKAIAFSPDGQKILFLRPANDVSGNNGRAVMDLFVVNSDGSGLVRLNPPGTVLGPIDAGVAGTPDRPVLHLRFATWSPESTQVAFAAGLGSPGEVRGGRVRRALFVVNADGTDAHRVRSGQILDAQWSPDGEWIAFSAADPDRPDVFVVHPDGTGLRLLTSPSDGLASWGPVWSPDGSWLLFVRNRDITQFDSNLWIVSLDGSGLAQVTHRVGEYFSYGWSSAARS